MPTTEQGPLYDIFISYRRGVGDELALLLQRDLQQRGLAVFLDRDLRRGVFDDKLLLRITESPTFLIVLTPNALDRCSDEEDWLRKEITQAIKSERNIVPVQVDSFRFTPELVKKLDPAIREIARYQTVVYSRDYFESTIERLVKIVEEDKADRRAAEEKRLAAERAKAWRNEKAQPEAEPVVRQKVVDEWPEPETDRFPVADTGHQQDHTQAAAALAPQEALQPRGEIAKTGARHPKKWVPAVQKMMSTNNDFTLTVIRLLLGVIFLAHGAQKTLGWFGGLTLGATMTMFTQGMGIPAPLAFLAIMAEFAGGIGLIVGFLGRIASLGIICNMLVAIFMVHNKFGFFMNWFGNQQGEGYEYHLLAIALAFVILVKGCGALSIDRALSGPAVSARAQTA